MFYEPEKRNHGLPHDPFKALVAPRPIGWISTRARDGRLNLAPYSYFNALSDNPWLVAFASDGKKDSMSFAQESGEFVVNIVTRKFAQAMVMTSVDAPRGASEFEFAGLECEPSQLVSAPRVKGIAAALECKVTQIVEPRLLSGAASGIQMVIGEAVGIHIDEDMLTNGRFDCEKAGLVSRLGYLDYAITGPLFEMRRPKWNEADS
jgi:flavin reductase (DIM6/NTAB) family NADH-FMN oxidoreductase RutF